ncbi:penicillin acylase family protein [Vibrio splendidus]
MEKKIIYTVFTIAVISTITFLSIIFLSQHNNKNAIYLNQLTSGGNVVVDDFGMPVISAENRSDAALITGYYHARDRFFQMDLLRRKSSGELSELFGEKTHEADKKSRVHQLRVRAEKLYINLPLSQRRILDSYAKGVNAGYSSLRLRPLEYIVLNSKPKEWEAVDSLLVVFTMYLVLQDENADKEYIRTLLKESFPSNFDFLFPNITKWDKSYKLSSSNHKENLQKLTDLKIKQSLNDKWGSIGMSEPFYGSSAWAVSGSRTKSGGAILSNDIHLGLTLPNLWYRLGIKIKSSHSVFGITIPGLPIIVAGSNGLVSWALTNTYGDWSDRTILPKKHQPSKVDIEIIKIRDKSTSFQVEHTSYGPIIYENENQKHAVKWLAHTERAINLNILSFETANNASEVLDLSPKVWLPPQNIVVVDIQGNIGWSVIGSIPVRKDHRYTTSPNFRNSWDWATPSMYPRIINPASGYIISANNRMVSKPEWATISHDDYVNGARAWLIDDRLKKLEFASINEIADVQFDNTAKFLEPWFIILNKALQSRAFASTDLIEAFDDWNGRADVNSLSYTIVKGARESIISDFYRPFLSKISSYYDEDKRQLTRSFRKINSHVDETVLSALANNKAIFFKTKDLNEYLYDIIQETYLKKTNNCVDINCLRWGKVNKLSIKHPMSDAPWPISYFYDYPESPQAGDKFMPLVANKQFGASVRFVIDTSRLEESLISMPGGQSGMPMSDNFRTGHSTWLDHEWLPFIGLGKSRKVEFYSNRDSN